MKRIVINIALVLIIINSSGVVANESRNLHRYFLANYHEFNGDEKKAHKYYNQLFGSNSSLHSYKGYINLLYKTGNYQRITQIAAQLEKNPKALFNNDPSLQLLVALSARNIGNHAMADERLISLSRTYKTDPEIIFHATDSYLRRKEPENALNMLSTFLNSTPSKATHYVFHFLKAQVLTQLGKNNEAIASAYDALKLHPYFDKGWLFVAMLQEQTGNINDAINSYKKFLETTPVTNKQIESHLMDLILKQKQSAQNQKTSFLNNKLLQEEYEYITKTISGNNYLPLNGTPFTLLKITDNVW